MSKLSDFLADKLDEAKDINLWLTRDEDDTLSLSLKKPKRDRDFGWMRGSGETYFFLPDELYPQVKSDDKEPQRVKLTLV